MNTVIVGLCPPPGYEYETIGPWFVTHVQPDGSARAWTTWTLASGITRFWAYDDDRYPARRVVVDARGITILGADSMAGGDLKMVGTRQAMDATLKMVESVGPPEDTIEVLGMVERLRERNGDAS